MQAGGLTLMIENPNMDLVSTLVLILCSGGPKKQTLVATSNIEAEYRSLVNTTAEILWLQSLLTELKVP